MSALSEIGEWISGNEALLSGIVALVVLIGFITSPLIKAVRHLRGRRRTSSSAEAKPNSAASQRRVDTASGSPLLAVLAFDNLSSDPEMQFFSDGVSEEIIQRLSRGAELKVIGKTTSFQFRGEKKAEAASKLQCSHILDGSIRRDVGKVRVGAHLIDTRSETTLWSEHYDRELQDIFAIQEDISSNIAKALRSRLTRAAADMVRPDDYDLYLRTNPKSFAPDELAAKIAMLEVVTGRSPEFADAWGRLAYLRAFHMFYRPYSERGAIGQRVTEEASHALSLDSENLEALTGKLFILKPYGEFIDAFTLLERLRKARGSGSNLYVAWFLRTGGFIEESVSAARETHRLNPLDPMAVNGLALSMLAAGRLDEAVPLYQELVETVPDMSFPVSSLLRVHAFRKDWEAVDRLLALAENRNLREFGEGLAFINALRSPTPQVVAEWSSTIQGANGRVDFSKAVYAAHLGLVDGAYAAIDAGRLGPACDNTDVMGPDAYRTSILFQANMPELRNDLRFPKLCARLGLVELWTNLDKWPDCASQVQYDFKDECKKLAHMQKEICNY